MHRRGRPVSSLHFGIGAAHAAKHVTTYDQPASDADLQTFLHGHRLTAAHPVLHADFAARLLAAGVRRIGGALVMPCGTPPGAWLADDADVRTALAREARRARGGGGAPGAHALPQAEPCALSPLAAAQARQNRAARVTQKLARANGELEGAE